MEIGRNLDVSETAHILTSIIPHATSYNQKVQELIRRWDSKRELFYETSYM